MLSNFASEYASRKVKANHKLLQFNSTHQVIIYSDDINLWCQSIHASSVHCKETGLEVNVEKAKNIFLFHEKQAAQNHNKINSLKVWGKFKYLWINLTYPNCFQKEINSSRVHLGNACCHLVQNHLLCSLLPKNLKNIIYTTINFNVNLYRCKTWSLMRRNLGWVCLRLGCWEWYLGLKEEGNIRMMTTKLWAGT